jgi:galactonate dehydratase
MPLSRSLLRKTNSVPAIAAIVPNFLSPEHFYPFNEPWTKELVTWTSELDVKTGHLPIPTSLGLGLDLNMDVVREHPYDPNAYFDTSKPGWERRLGAGAKRIS